MVVVRVKLIRLLKIGWFSLGLLPVVPFMFGYYFLSSPKWISDMKYPAFVAGTASAVWLLCVLTAKWEALPGDGWKKCMAVLGSPLMGYFVGKNIVYITGPMLLAFVVGHSAELTLTVRESKSTRGCQSPVEFRELSFLFDKICNVPAGIRQGVAPGEIVVVSGHGTNLGLFAASIKR